MTLCAPAQYSPSSSPIRASAPSAASASLTRRDWSSKRACRPAVASCSQRDVLDDHAALVEDGRVPADRAQERRRAAPARDLARPPEAGQQRVQAAEGDRRPRPEDAQRRRPAPARDVRQQRVRERDVEDRIRRERGGDQRERASCEPRPRDREYRARAARAAHRSPRRRRARTTAAYSKGGAWACVRELASEWGSLLPRSP